MLSTGARSKPTSRRYSPQEKEQAVRMVRALREELGTSQGTVKRVADQLGYGVESVRGWDLVGYAVGGGDEPRASFGDLKRDSRPQLLAS